MRKFTKVVKRDRKLSQEQITEFNEIVALQNELVKQTALYPDDPDIKELEQEVIKLANEALRYKDDFLATPIEEPIEYEVDMELFEELKQRVENFKKLVAL